MKIIDTDLKDYSGSEFNVYKDSEGVTFMKFSNGLWLDNRETYASIFLGKCDSCTGFYKDSFKDFVYDSVLIAGLGFGLIPHELSEVNKCSKIDVVEISQEVIDYNVSSGHLNPIINIIKGDIFTHTTDEKYDLIIIDTIWEEAEMTEEQYQELVSKFYNTNLNKGGALYFPVLHKWLIK
tara:strand:+ start:10993 stop:11532 length:540 start_codon:yes stop_codon:yes gene_type:complete